MIFIFNVVTKDTSRNEFIASFDMMKTVPGFQGISLFQDQSNKNKFMCIEFWDNKESHIQHVKEIPPGVADAWLTLLEEISEGQYCEKIAEIRP